MINLILTGNPRALRQNGYRVYASHKGTFFIPQKSLKRVQIHKLFSEKGPKTTKIKSFPLKGSRCPEISTKILVKINQVLKKSATI